MSTSPHPVQTPDTTTSSISSLMTTVINYIRQKYPEDNMIFKALMYLFHSTNKIEQDILNIMIQVYDRVKTSSQESETLYKDFEVVAAAAVLSYTSVHVLFDLPHMCDRYSYKNMPCLHITYGEIVTQLTSVCLTTLAIELINDRIQDNTLKIYIFDIIQASDPEEKFVSLLDAQNRVDFKTKLDEQLKESEQKLLCNIVNICFSIWGYKNKVPAKTVKNLILDVQNSLNLNHTHN